MARYAPEHLLLLRESALLMWHWRSTFGHTAIVLPSPDGQSAALMYALPLRITIVQLPAFVSTPRACLSLLRQLHRSEAIHIYIAFYGQSRGGVAAEDIAEWSGKPEEGYSSI